jgi:precorrin-8X/cobalt-precorrin-8 methylmutase
MEMVRSGINKKLLRPFGCEVLCFISDPEVASVSERDGRTRAESAVDLAVDVMKDGIYVIGNAPTALIRLLDLVDEGKAAPALIVGFPVGFVNAAESKERLSGYSCPYITNLGRRVSPPAAQRRRPPKRRSSILFPVLCPKR